MIMTWRNSVKLSFSLKILFSSSSNLNFVSSSSSSSSSSIFIVNGVVQPILSQSYYQYSSSPSLSIPSLESTTKLGFFRNKSDGIRAFASSTVAAVDFSSKTRDAMDLARHYARCYWELALAC